MDTCKLEAWQLVLAFVHSSISEYGASRGFAALLA